MERQKIKFRDLSWPLKVGIVIGWFWVGFYAEVILLAIIKLIWPIAGV